jgi:phytoene/squalene synthetase
LNTKPIPDGPQLPAVDHYESFPVASWLLPGQLRAPVRLIYAFARQADDFADEGDDTPQQRLGWLAIVSSTCSSVGADSRRCSSFSCR